MSEMSSIEIVWDDGICYACMEKLPDNGDDSWLDDGFRCKDCLESESKHSGNYSKVEDIRL